MEKKRSFNNFFASSGEEGIRTVALEYATSDDTVTIEKIAQRYNVTIGGVKKIFEYAIVNCLVSYRIAILMKTKAHRNQARHIDKKSERTSSDKYYDSLLEKRLETVKSFSSDRIREIVDLYLDSPNLSAKEVAYSVGLSKQELNLTIKNAIVFNIVDDNTVDRLNKLALYKVLSRKEQILISEILLQYKNLRTFYISLITKIEALKFQLRTYEEFVSSSDDMEKLKKDTEKELKKAEKALFEFKASFFKK